MFKNRSSSGVTKIRDYSYADNWRSKSAELKANKGRKCIKCGTTGSSNNRLETHHLIEKARGGPDSEANTTVLCENCHAAMHPNNKGMRAKKRKRLLR